MTGPGHRHPSSQPDPTTSTRPDRETDAGEPYSTMLALAGHLRMTLDMCDEHPGQNLPDLLAIALARVAHGLDGVDALVRHRPDSWEAKCVMALAVGADW